MCCKASRQNQFCRMDVPIYRRTRGSLCGMSLRSRRLRKMFSPLGMEVIIEDGKEDDLFGGKVPALSIEFPVIRHHRVWVSQDRQISMAAGRNDHVWDDLELTDPGVIRVCCTDW